MKYNMENANDNFIDATGSPNMIIMCCYATGPNASALSALVQIICEQLPGRTQSLIMAPIAVGHSPDLPVAVLSPFTHWTTAP